MPRKLNKTFPWTTIRNWMHKHRIEKEHVGLGDVVFRGRPTPEVADRIFAKMWSLILENSSEGADLRVIEGQYRAKLSGGQWGALRFVTANPVEVDQELSHRALKSLGDEE